MSPVSLSDLLAGARPDSHCVAIRNDQRITLAQLRADVLHNADRLRPRAIRRAAVICNEGYWFIVGVLALMKIGADVILPPNAQTGTLLSVLGEVDGLLTDSWAIDHEKVIVLEPGRAEVAAFQADFERGRIDFFTSARPAKSRKLKKSLILFEREASVLEQMWGAELGETPIVGTVTHQHVFGMTFRIIGRLWRAGLSSFGISRRLGTADGAVEWSLDDRDEPGATHTSWRPRSCTAANRPRMIISAGAPLPAEAANAAIEIFGCNPTEILGSTEAGVVAWRRDGPEPVLWQPLLSVEVAASSDGVMILAISRTHPATDGASRLTESRSLSTDVFASKGESTELLRSKANA